MSTKEEQLTVVVTCTAYDCLVVYNVFLIALIAWLARMLGCVVKRLAAEPTEHTTDAGNLIPRVVAAQRRLFAYRSCFKSRNGFKSGQRGMFHAKDRICIGPRDQGSGTNGTSLIGKSTIS